MGPSLMTILISISISILISLWMVIIWSDTWCCSWINGQIGSHDEKLLQIFFTNAFYVNGNAPKPLHSSFIVPSHMYPLHNTMHQLTIVSEIHMPRKMRYPLPKERRKW